ncbi:MAG: imidazolonepropionase [Thermoprotei archaeon]
MIVDYLLKCGRLITPQAPCELGAGATLLRAEDWGLAVVGGRIVDVGEWSRLSGVHEPRAVINFSDYTVLPGLVDPHTHLLYYGNRSDELALKLEGLSYSEIAARGGGIMKTVKWTRSASDEELLAVSAKRVRGLLNSGVTTLEVKSGYGLSYESEVRLLSLINTLKERVEARVLSTLLSAHAPPEEYDGRVAEYVEQVVFKTVDYASTTGLADFVDVFCEPGYFSVYESRRILEYAKTKGMKVRLHADEFQDSGGASLAADVGALSADHLAQANPQGLARMAERGVVAVILPLLFHYSMMKPPHADKFRVRGLVVGLGTDLNPNCQADSMIVAMNHAVYSMRFTPSEALCAASVNSAKALGLGDVGCLNHGYSADISVYDVEDEADLVSRLGRSPLVFSMCRGRPIRNEGVNI